MDFLLMCLFWLLVGLCAASAVLLVMNGWLSDRNESNSAWHDKVRNQIRRVLLY